MRLVTLDSREVGGRPGVWLPSGEILDLAAVPGTLEETRWRPQSVISVIAEGDTGRARLDRLVSRVGQAGEPELTAWRQAGTLLPYAGTQLLAPVRRPGLLLMVRTPELMTPAPGALVTAIKNPNAVVGPDSAVVLPDTHAERLWAAPMIGLVLGRALFAGGSAEAARAIGALTILVDLGLQPAPDGTVAGRQFPGACPMGPAFVTLDELAGRGELVLALRVNGHRVSQQILLPETPAVAELVAAVSRDYALRPGDILGLQCPPADYPLGRGDRVTVALEDCMELRFFIS